MSLYLVRCDGSDIAVVAPTMKMAIDATVERIMEENADEEDFDRDYAQSTIEQVICLDAETILIVDRKSWTAYIDDEMQPDWRGLTEEAT